MDILYHLSALTELVYSQLTYDKPDFYNDSEGSSDNHRSDNLS